LEFQHVLVQPPDAVHGQPRPVRIEDLPRLGQLLDDVFRRSRGVFDQSQLTDFPLVFDPSNLANCQLIEMDGLVVSHAALWPRELICDGRQFQAAVVVSVATHTGYRNRGLAASLMRVLHERLHERAYDLAILWTAVPDFYCKLGWRTVVPRGMIVDLDRANADRISTSGYECRPYDAARHLDRLLEIYGEQPVRLARNRSEAERLFALPKVPVWVATRGGQVGAYVCQGRAINKRGVTEYGGKLDGILALLRHIADSMPAEETIPLLAYHTRPDLLDWVRASGLPARPLSSSKGANHEMIYIVRQSVPVDLLDRIFVWGMDHA
jgi:N-acetylglutamate synthase-like GNAT family acetyltransferase